MNIAVVDELFALNPRATIRLADYQGETIEVAFGEGNRRRQLTSDSHLLASWLLAHTGPGLSNLKSVHLAQLSMGLSLDDAEALVRNVIDEGLLIPSNERKPPTASEMAWLRWGWRDALDFHLSTRDVVFESGDRDGMNKQYQALMNWEQQAKSGQDEASPGPYKEYINSKSIGLLSSRDLIDSITFGETIYKRRTTRGFDQRQISFKAISELFLHACGETGHLNVDGAGKQLLKTSPSGGARHPVESYAAIFNVEGITPGLYHYNVRSHCLELIRENVDSKRVWELAHRQGGLDNISMSVFFTARWKRHIWKYRYSRSYRMVMFDVAHIVQTFILTATATDLRTFLTPALADNATRVFLGIQDDLEESALYCVGVG